MATKKPKVELSAEQRAVENKKHDDRRRAAEQLKRDAAAEASLREAVHLQVL
jgi:hypothetical protein